MVPLGLARLMIGVIDETPSRMMNVAPLCTCDSPSCMANAGLVPLLELSEDSICILVVYIGIDLFIKMGHAVTSR